MVTPTPRLDCILWLNYTPWLDHTLWWYLHPGPTLYYGDNPPPGWTMYYGDNSTHRPDHISWQHPVVRPDPRWPIRYGRLSTTTGHKVWYNVGSLCVLQWYGSAGCVMLQWRRVCCNGGGPVAMVDRMLQDAGACRLQYWPDWWTDYCEQHNT